MIAMTNFKEELAVVKMNTTEETTTKEIQTT